MSWGSSLSSCAVSARTTCWIACGLRNSSKIPPMTSRTPSRPLSTRPILKVLSSAGDSGSASSVAGALLTGCWSGFGCADAGGRLREWWGSVMAVPGLVDALGEVFQGFGAFLEPPLGHWGVGGAEQVAGPDGAVPAAQPVQALFFLIQLGERQLALPNLVG